MTVAVRNPPRLVGSGDQLVMTVLLAVVGLLAALIVSMAILFSQAAPAVTRFAYDAVAPLLPEPDPLPAPTVRPKALASAAQWYTTDDYPAASVRRGAQGVVRPLLHIDPLGRVRRCDIALSSGDADLDAATCSAAIRRGRFAPARDARGRPIWAVIPGSKVHWVLHAPTQ